MQVAYICIQQKRINFGANYSVIIKLKRDLVIKVLSHLPFMLETSGNLLLDIICNNLNNKISIHLLRKS